MAVQTADVQPDAVNVPGDAVVPEAHATVAVPP
jgi:hypothetical protein